jgi:hypothetical protein
MLYLARSEALGTREIFSSENKVFSIKSGCIRPVGK